MTTELVQWEYKSESMTRNCVGALKCFGDDGWELCGVGFEITSGQGQKYATFFFKRPIIQSPDKQEP